MKILFILENHYPNIGGVETLFKSLTESLVQHGSEVTVLTNQFSKDLKREETINGVNIIRVPFHNRYLFTLFGLFPALKYARRSDLIHTTSYNAGVPAYFAGLLTRKKVIITFHEVWGNLWFKLPFMGKFSLSLHYLFEKALLQLPFSKFIAVSQSTANNLKNAGIKEERIIKIYNGIKYEEFSEVKALPRKEDDNFEFVYFGRLGVSKGLDLLLSATKQLYQNRQDFKLKLIIPLQPAAFHQKIKDLISDYKIADIITIKSELPRAVLLSDIKNSDAVIIPSYSEGFCFTAAESMALGTPIISSGKGSLREVVNGIHLTMKEHSPEALALCMNRALESDWETLPPKDFHLSDSIYKYLDLYISFLT